MASILPFFWPRVLERVESPISGEIKIVEEFGKRRMEIGGITQSGGMVEKIWEKTAREIIKLSNYQIANCLILGLGAGTAAKIISNIQYPISNIKIAGVEIDPQIVNLGKKYFGLGEIPRLEIVIADTVRFINQLPIKQPAIKGFNLILVDIYQGRKIPPACETPAFLENLKKLKKTLGLIIFNRLYGKNEREETEKFLQKCRKIFTEVEAKNAICNKMIFCR